MYDVLGIDKRRYQNEFNRGIYFSSFYKNTKEFLRSEISQDDLVMEGYRFVGIKRAEDDETARKVREYQEQGRDLEKLSVSVMTGERSEQILEGVEAYFVR